MQAVRSLLLISERLYTSLILGSPQPTTHCRSEGALVEWFALLLFSVWRQKGRFVSNSSRIGVSVRTVAALHEEGGARVTQGRPTRSMRR